MSTERRFLVLLLAAVLLLGQLAACRAAPQPEVSKSPEPSNQLSPPTSSTSSMSGASGEPEMPSPADVKPNKVDKLRRGLTSFLNKNNPASFFVPSAQQVGGLPALKGPGPDSATLVNADPSADGLIKGPNRLAHTRPIGGPLRWGR